MATTFALTIACSPNETRHAERLLFECHQCIAQIESELTEYQASSPVSRLNHSRMGEWIDLSGHADMVFDRAEQLSALTARAFDPWAKSTSVARAEMPRYERRAAEIRRLDLHAHLGFGAIGKGYALDCVRLLIEQSGFSHFCLSAGGSSIILSGSPETCGKSAWPLAWAWKRSAKGELLGSPLAVSETASTSSWAIGISGSLEQGGHIKRLDAHAITARPPLSTFVAVQGSAADADALSTALYASGWDRGLPALGRYPLGALAVAAVDEDLTPHWNGVFHDRIGPLAAQSNRIGVALLSIGLVMGVTAPQAMAQDAVDLDSLDNSLDDRLNDRPDNATTTTAVPTKSFFNPYTYEREPAWILCHCSPWWPCSFTSNPTAKNGETHHETVPKVSEIGHPFQCRPHLALVAGRAGIGRAV